MYSFAKDVLTTYREAGVDDKSGPALVSSLKKISKSGKFSIGGEHYKRVPSGYDANHPNAQLLKHNGLHTGMEMDIPELLYSRELLDFCYDKFKAMAPLNEWISESLG